MTIEKKGLDSISTASLGSRGPRENSDRRENDEPSRRPNADACSSHRGLRFYPAAQQWQFSRFDRVQAQETEHCYAGKSDRAESFFRKGEVGSWQGLLSAELVEQLVADHGEVMRRFGYLSAGGEPVC